MALNLVCDFPAPFSDISAVTLYFNGAGNIVLYALNNRRFLPQSMPHFSHQSSSREFSFWAGVTNVPVGFSVWLPEERRVRADQGLALRVSESEIRSLETLDITDESDDGPL